MRKTPLAPGYRGAPPLATPMQGPPRFRRVRVAMSTPDFSVARGARVRPDARVSVVIPAWFKHATPGPRWLDEALDSVRAQRYEDWEIIVVDDGSPVPVRPARTDDIVLIHQSNTGPGGARNTGVRHARGEFIAYLDADDRWQADKLGRQVDFLDANPEILLVCADAVILHEDGTHGTARTVREKGAAVGDRIPFEKLFHENCIPCSTVMVRRAALERTPGMHPHRRLGEDFGLWLRIGLLGPIGYLEEPFLERRRHGDGLMAATFDDGSWITSEREVYAEFLDEHPGMRAQPFVRRAMARLNFQAGWSCMTRGEWSRARRLLLESVANDPTRFKAWVNLARSVLRVGS